MKKTKILYIHHGGGMDGASMSLLYLLNHLDRDRYEPIVACGKYCPAAKELFEKNGFETRMLSMSFFSHVWPAGWWPLYSPKGILQLLNWVFLQHPRFVKDFKKVVREVQPDIVHFNSLVLAPATYTARRMGLKVVLHVRESVIKGTVGIRLKWLRWLANSCTNWTIYICKDNQNKLTGSTKNSSVIYNPIPFEKFDYTLDGTPIREELHIPKNATVLFFPGGSGLKPKGIIPFLQAFKQIRKTNKNVFALLPEKIMPPKTWWQSLQFWKKNDQEIIKTFSPVEGLIRAPFSLDVHRYFALSDLIVVPFVVPHFSRAVMEAGAMKKPVVGSRIGGIKEVVDENITGLLAEPNNAIDLSNKLLKLIENKQKQQSMGEAGYKNALRLFHAKDHAIAVMKIYDQLK